MVTTILQLPSEADAEELSRELMRAHDAVERLTWQLAPLEDYTGLEDEPQVTAEHVAALAAIRDDLRHRADDLRDLERLVERRLSQAIGLRGEQQPKRSRDLV